MLKKVFSILLVSLFIISLIPLSSLAADTAPKSDVSAPGGSVSTVEELVAALGGSGIVYENGVITLIKDVTLASSVRITSGTYTVMGSGAIIKGAFDGDVFVLSGEGTTLILGDRTAGEDDTDLTFDGENTVRGGSFFKVEKGAKLELRNSVKIENAISKTSGAAVYNEGEFTMYGGKIENCRAEKTGGAVYNAGSLFLTSGSIKNCSANQGGAVYSEGESTFAGTELSGCKATNGGAVYNTGNMQYRSSAITECSADKGGAVYNSGKASVNGGTISNNKAENGEGGGVYNVSELELSGSVIRENYAKNGGNVYNCGNASTGDGFAAVSGNASEKGGNVYNSELGIFTQNSGSVNLGRAVYGGGVYNLGTYNLNAGGIYANKAEVADGLLNHGKLVLSNKGYCEKGDDIFVVLSEENTHAVTVAKNWSYSTNPVSVSCGVYENGKYSYSHSSGDKILDLKGEINVSERFLLHVPKTGLIISDNGALAKAPATVSKTLVTVISIILAYPLVTAAMVYVIRLFDKKKHQAELK